MEKNLTFSAALVRAKKGDEIARAAWDEGTRLLIAEGDILVLEGEERSSWSATNDDLLAEDWAVVKEAE